MANRNEITFADEQMGFAEFDAVANELSSPSHDEEPVAILLDLRSLVGVVGVFDGEIVDVNPEEQKLKVLVDIFERQVPVELGFDQVKKID